MITLRIMNEKEKQSVLDEIKETEKYGFQTLEERLPVWIKQSKRAIRNNWTVNTLRVWDINPREIASK